MSNIRIIIDGNYSANAMNKIAAIIRREINGLKLPFTLRNLVASIDGDVPGASVEIITKPTKQKEVIQMAATKAKAKPKAVAKKPAKAVKAVKKTKK